VSSIIELNIGRADAPGSYEIQVIQSPAGEASATFELEPVGLIDKLDELQQTLLASSVSSRRLVGRGEASVRRVGQRLFEALFTDPQVAGVYRASNAVAAERGETLRIVLRLSASELATLPWESMFDPSTGSYVSRREPLVRYVPVPSSPPPLKVRLPLRILALIASPRGLAQLDTEKEKDNLTRALQPMINSGSVAVEWLEHATWPAVQDLLLAESWHIIHFIGHGDFDIDRDEGVLALENDNGRLNRVPAESVVDLLREAQPMPRLVVLNACESSTSSQSDLFSGVAAALVRGGVSAVTAMQFEISDQAAIAFSRGFYTSIGHGRSVDEAVRSGRVGIVGLGADSLEWITPTLYLRGEEGHLFDLTDSTGEAMSEPVLAERRSQAAEATEQRDVATAVPLYDSVLAENPDDEAARQGRARAIDAARQAQGPPDGQTSTPYRKSTTTADSKSATGTVKDQASSNGKLRWLSKVAMVLAVAVSIAAIALALRSSMGRDTGAVTSPSSAVTSPSSVVTVQRAIPATQVWTDMNLQCASGDKLQIAVSGRAMHEDSARGEVGPTGLSDPRYHRWNVPGLPDANTVAVIGSLDQALPLFVVGNGTTYTCPREGALFLGVNDIGVQNNSGEFTAKITKTHYR
jgi:CHAT domain